MKLIASVSMRCSAALGIPPRHQHRAHPCRTRNEHAVQEPGDVRKRRGHEHRVAGTEPVHAHHRQRLVREPPVRMEDGLRLTGRAPGEERNREVRRARRAAADRRAVGQWRTGGDRDRGIEHAEHALDLHRAGLVVDRTGDRAQAPARAVQQHRLVAVGELPCDDATPRDALGLQPAGDPCHRVLVGRESSLGQQRVKRRHVPCTTRPEVLRGSGVPVRRSESGHLRSAGGARRCHSGCCP